jgi:hypothetical protein
MKLSDKSLEKLRNLINEEIEYRFGPKLVEFFNKFGFNDEYGQGFPSRWQYTDEKLSQLNNTDKLQDVVTELFNPINHIERIEDLDRYIMEFNQYLTFDKKDVALSEMKRVTKDEGKIIISVYSEKALEERLKMYKEIEVPIEDMKGGNIIFNESVGAHTSEQFSLDDIKEIIEPIGLEIVNNEEVENIAHLITLQKT